MESIGFALATGVASGVTGLAVADAFARSKEAHVTVFGHPVLSAISKHVARWVDVDFSKPRETMSRVLACEPCQHTFALGGDSFVEAVAAVSGTTFEAFPVSDGKRSAQELWFDLLNMQASVLPTDWNSEPLEDTIDVLLVPGKPSSGHWADDEWPGDYWVELARRDEFAGKHISVLALSASPSVLDIARVEGVRIVPDSLSLPSLIGIVSNANMVISTDDGIATLGALLRRPVIELQGSVPHTRWMPESGHYHVVKPGLNNPLSSITPERVAEILNKIQVPLAYF